MSATCSVSGISRAAKETTMMRAESKRLATVLDEKCAATPTHPAILYRDRTICYAELQDESLAAARSLFALGDRKGVVEGKSVYVRVDHGGRRIIKKKKQR